MHPCGFQLNKQNKNSLIMKKTLIAVLALAAVAACNKAEVIEQNSNNAIVFDAPFIENSTKAEDITSENLNDFGVWGYVQDLGGVIFTHETVTKSGSDWKYANTQYWVAEKPYYFTAVAPAAQAEKYSATAVDAGTISFDNTSASVDLLHAYAPVAAIAAPITQQPDAVPFIFKHLLSRVKFSFENTMVAENATITISNVSVSDAYKKGTATITSGKLALWEGEGENQVAFEGIADAVAKGKEGETEHMYFIPANKTYKLTFTVALAQGTVAIATKTHTVEIPAVEMLAGYSYDFKAILNEKNVVEELYPITFTATATPWVEFSSTTVPVQ